MQSKAQMAEIMRSKASVGSGTWWAVSLSSGGAAESLSLDHRRWRAAMFPFQQLGQVKCPMCSLPNSNLHLAIECAHWEIQETREVTFQQMDTAMLEWQENGIPERCAEAWPKLS